MFALLAFLLSLSLSLSLSPSPFLFPSIPFSQTPHPPTQPAVGFHEIFHFQTSQTFHFEGPILVSKMYMGLGLHVSFPQAIVKNLAELEAVTNTREFVVGGGVYCDYDPDSRLSLSFKT